MALDVEIVGGAPVPTRTFRVEAGAAASIAPGKPVKIGGTGNNYVTLLATGDPEVGTDRMVGVSASTSTDTASADGTVDVYMVRPNETIMRSKVTTAANIDTDAELLAILNDSVTYDLSGGTFTVDEDEGDDPDVHGLVILGGDITEGTVDYILKTGASIEGLIA